MSKRNWINEAGNPRPQDALIPETVRPQRGKKNTRKWCRGKVGTPHRVEVVRHHYYSHTVPCHWWQGYVKRSWVCYHAQRCTVCGKYLLENLRSECPEFKDAP